MVFKRIAVIALLAGGAIAVRWWAPFALEPKSAIDWLRAMDPAAQVGAFVLAYGVLTTLAVPAFVLHIASAIAFGFERGLVIALIAANVASNLQFGVGRAIGSERLHAWLEKRGMKPSFAASSIAALVVLRTIPTPFLALNVGCGAAGMPWRTFVVGSGLGLISVVSAQTFFGAQVYAGVEGASMTALLWAAAGAAVIVALALLPRWLKRRNQPPAAP